MMGRGELSATSMKKSAMAFLSFPITKAKYPGVITIAKSAPASFASFESLMVSRAEFPPVPTRRGVAWSPALSRAAREAEMIATRSSALRWEASPLVPLMTGGKKEEGRGKGRRVSGLDRDELERGGDCR